MQFKLSVLTISLVLLGATGYALSQNTSSKTVAQPSHVKLPPQAERIGNLEVMRSMMECIYAPDNIEELIAKSDIIAIGKPATSVTESKTLIQRHSDGSVIGAISEVEFKVTKVFKGDSNTKSVKVGQQAAVMTDKHHRKFVQILEGYQPMEKDKKYLLFLRKSLSGNLYFPNGVMFGKHNTDGTDKEEVKSIDVRVNAIRKLALERFKE